MDDLILDNECKQFTEQKKVNFSIDMQQDQQLEFPRQKKKEQNDDSKINLRNYKKKSKAKKHKSTYNREVFKSPQYLPKWGQFELIGDEKIKLTVTLKDIGLEGLDSYETKSKQEIKPPKTPPESPVKNNNIINEIENNNNDKLNEEMLMKKVQKAWIERKKQTKKINTYDPEIFQNPEYGPPIKPQFEDVPPVKLNVKLMDIGLKGLDSFNSNSKPKIKQEKIQEIKPPEIPPKNETNEIKDDNELDEKMLMKRVQEKWKERKKMLKSINTYSPLKFRLSYYSPKKKIKPKGAPPIKLSVTLKDIGLEGLDAYPPISTVPNTIKNNKNREKNKKNGQNQFSFAIKQPNESPHHSNIRVKRRIMNSQSIIDSSTI